MWSYSLAWRESLTSGTKIKYKIEQRMPTAVRIRSRTWKLLRASSLMIMKIMKETRSTTKLAM